jgi:hypothetical protein
MASNVLAMTHGLATERWINEGVHLAPEAVFERELRADHRLAARPRRRGRPRVLIAGGGVAASSRCWRCARWRAIASITLVAPELRFVNRSMAVVQPFRTQRLRGVRLEDVAAEHGVRWRRGALDRVERERRIVVTTASHCCSTSSVRAVSTSWPSSSRPGRAGRCRSMTSR